VDAPDTFLPAPTDPRQQRWPWWPLLPLYPYGRRLTLMRELVPGRVWSFEQLHGIWYVAVPIRMIVVKVDEGLLLYAPLPPTAELLAGLRRLEAMHGPVLSIVLATSSGLEHKLPVAPLMRACPGATLWISERQWSFPLQLPSSWLGFPAHRTRILGSQGFPHPEQLDWIPLGPIDLGLGTFHELACVDRASGALLVTDALVSIPAATPPIFERDPTPLLFHARDRGAEPMRDTPEQRLKGWKRIVLFANYFRPSAVNVPSLADLLSDALDAEQRSPRNHFGLYPFRWSEDWEQQADRLIHHHDAIGFGVAPVLERLVFVRSRDVVLAWLRRLASAEDLSLLIPAHYGEVALTSSDVLADCAEQIEARTWAPSQDSWELLATIDQLLVRTGVVPGG
jgi:hypothetical protein